MAVTTKTRQTGLIARIIDSNLNSWEDFASLDINIPVVYEPVDTSDGEWDQAHWSYRGQAAICKLADGTFVRVRIGDWTNTSSRVVQRQVIDAPEDPSDWTLWTTLYSGSHYAIAIEADPAAAAGYRIYHAKSDGLYMDNVKIISKTGIVRIKPVVGKRNMITFKTVQQDVDGNKEERWWYATNTLLVSGAPLGYLEEDDTNYRWYHHDLAVVQGVPNWYYRFRAWPLNASARHQYASDTLTCDVGHSVPNAGSFWDDRWSNARSLKGPSKQSGFSRIDNMVVTVIADNEFRSGAYYLFYTEQHMDAFGNTLSNLKSPVFWSRSVGYPYYLSEAMPTGFSVWGLAGVVDDSNYVYIAGNGRVLRRPLQSEEYEVTDYVVEGGYELPRDNGAGSGSLLCANPKNIIGKALGLSSSSGTGPLTERRVSLGLGIRKPGEGMDFKVDDSWWLTGMNEVEEEGKQRLKLDLGNFWHRLELPFRDLWTIPGRFEWHDWQPGATNQVGPYWHNDSDEWHSYTPSGSPAEWSIPRLRTIASGDGPLGGTITLFTGQNFENGFIEAKMWATSGGGLVFRYVDADNFYYVEVHESADEDIYEVNLHLVEEGEDNILGLPTTISEPPDSWMSVDFRWGHIQAIVGSETIVWDRGSGLDVPRVWAGSVGLYAPTQIEASNIYIHEWSAKTTSRELIKMLLAYAGEHEIEFESDTEALDAEQVSTVWGPQSDLATPEKALRQLLETSKLSIAWLQDG